MLGRKFRRANLGSRKIMVRNRLSLTIGKKNNLLLKFVDDPIFL